MRKSFLITTFLLLLGLFSSTVHADGTGKVRAVDYSCPGKVTITYDLTTSQPAGVELYYSPNKTDWALAKTVTGDNKAQSSGAGKTIVWDCFTDNVHYGGFYFKVVVLTQPSICECKVRSTLADPPYNGWITFMCYNLGADPNMTIEEQMAYTPTSNTDPTVYGDLYQWGRPIDGHEKRTSDTTSILATTNTPEHSNFILTTNDPYDWRSGGGETARWGDGSTNAAVPKATNDPCPDGWRMPTEKEWESIYGTASGNTWTWSRTATSGYKITPAGSSEPTLFLPAAGDRFENNGMLNSAGSYGYYWSSTVLEVYSYYLFFYSSRVSPNGYCSNRAEGKSCRCVAE